MYYFLLKTTANLSASWYLVIKPYKQNILNKTRCHNKSNSHSFLMFQGKQISFTSEGKKCNHTHYLLIVRMKKVIITPNHNAAGKTISHAITQSLTPNIEI